MLNKGVRGVVFVAVVFVTAVVTCVLSVPVILTLFLPLEMTRNAYRLWMEWAAHQWFSLASAMLEDRCAGTMVHFSGDLPPVGERALIMSNHRTRVDWMYLWSLCARLDQLRSLRIVAKDSLRSMPAIGWGMQMFLFIFLTRKKENDLKHIGNVLDYFVRKDKRPPTLLIFPEGTDLSPSNLKAAHEFEKSKNLPLHNQVLHPKTKGLVHSLHHLREDGIDALYDVTMGYVGFEDGERPSEKSLLLGRFPKEVHIHVRRVPLAELPEADDGMETFVHDSFARKERMLSAFYGGAGAEEPSRGPNKFTDAPDITDEIGDRVNINGCHSRALWFYGIVCAVLAGLMIVSHTTRWYFVWAGVFFVLETKLLGGLDRLELFFHAPGGMFSPAMPKREPRSTPQPIASSERGSDPTPGKPSATASGSTVGTTVRRRG